MRISTLWIRLKCALVAAILLGSAGLADAQPPSMRGDGGGPGGMMGGPGGMMGGPGGMMGGRGGRGGRGGMPGGGPEGFMGGRDRGGMPGGGPGGFMGGRDRGGMSGGGRDRGGRDRGGRGSAPPGEGGDSGEDRFARFEGMLRGFDTNKDGVIDPKEVPEDRRRFLGFIGGRMGVDFSKPVAIDKLREKAAERFGGGNQKNKEPEPLVPGFGTPTSEATVLAFGERASEATASGTSSSARRQDSNQQDPRAQGFADMMMRRYDQDGNGVLERDRGEWEGVRGDPNEIDSNNDGRIDRDEMVARVAAYMGGNRGRERGSDRGGEGGGRGGEGGSRGGEAREDNQQDTRKSYRFLSAAERLPEGLPGWFTERDQNKDGQISMAEYSSYWSDTKAREYLRYDLNDDGMITPDECLTAASRPEYVAPTPENAGQPPANGDKPPGDVKPAGETKPEEKKDSSGAKPWWMSS